MSRDVGIFISGAVVGAIVLVLAAAIVERELCNSAGVATANSEKDTKAQIEKLKKDVDAVSQQLTAMVSAHNKMVEGTQSILIQESREMTVVARALSDDYGQKKWIKMVDKARQELDEDMKKAVEEAKAKKAEGK